MRELLSDATGNFLPSVGVNFALAEAALSKYVVGRQEKSPKPTSNPRGKLISLSFSI